MTGIAFDRSFECEPGAPVQVSPLVRRIVAPNPGPFTFHGTGTYLVGRGQVAVIDPGPRQAAHLDAISRALGGETIAHILVTHTHVDHSPLARPLKDRCGAPISAYGPHGQGEHERGATVEEGADHDFAPDIRLRHGDVVSGPGWTLECVHTPGHTSNHLCYALRQESALFSGDHVMGWSTTVVSPPDGDMRAYMSSLRLLLGREDALYWPTHGGPVREPKPFVQALIAHRGEREQQVLACLANGVARIAEMVPRIYGSTIGRHLYPAAARSVFAHVIDLVDRGMVECEGAVSVDADYRLAA